MNLKIQIISLGFSFVFGITFFLLVYLNKLWLFYSRKVVKVISSILFVLDMSLLYFFILKIINQGILHIYFLIMFLIGCYCGNLIMKKWCK